MHPRPRKSNVPDMSPHTLEGTTLITSFMSQGTGVLQSAPKYGVFFTDQLKFLWGQPLNNLAWNWLHSLRASVIKITKDDDDFAAVLWGVTIFVDTIDGQMVINNIKQAVEVGVVGIPESNTPNGIALMRATNAAIKASQPDT